MPKKQLSPRAARAVIRRLATPPGPALRARRTDRFLVSYPRSGNTWVRFLVANAAWPETGWDFGTIGRAIPDIYVDTRLTVWRAPNPRLLKSHEALDARYARMVYLVRNPFDVAVSYYHFLLKMRHLKEGFELARYVDAFVGGTIDRLGSWGDHVRGWLDAREGTSGFLLVRYEDVAADPARSLARILRHLDIDADDRRVRTAVEASSAAALRELERTSIAAQRVMRDSRPDKLFVRTATAGDWRRELPPELADEIASAWRDVLERLGYSACP